MRELCIQAGMPAEKLIVSGMPVAARFADRLIYDPACAERMLAAQAAWLPRNGAEQIAAAVTAH